MPTPWPESAAVQGPSGPMAHTAGGLFYRADLLKNFPMSIFRRIFNFEKASVEQLEKRLSQRHPIGAGFPLQGTLRNAGRDHSVKVIDMSSNGLGLIVAPGSTPSPGHHVQFQLALDHHRLELDARIAHQQDRDSGEYIGLSLVFPEFEQQKTYLQLLQPVVMGQSLRPMPAEGIFQDDPRFLKQGYTGNADNQLTVWLDPAQALAVHSFEFRMQNYFCRGGLATGRTEAGELGATGPVLETSGGLHEEILQLFRWVIMNLSADVPENVRAFLRRFAQQAR